MPASGTAEEGNRILLEQMYGILEQRRSILANVVEILEQSADLLAHLGNILENRQFIRTNKNILEHFQIY
ncbi:phosphomannomutase [Solibacillus sp. FSL W7-1464]|uniref:phosphomannomutase n=1 Tax=Solibacillus sp. FSL W7-1464 TaxID=2921706 RepID=UPI0030F6B8C6